jgi:hypothetical protein
MSPTALSVRFLEAFLLPEIGVAGEGVKAVAH